MAQSSIITGQYVELTQTPASVGDRLLAAIIDYAILGAYVLVVVLGFIGPLETLLYNVSDVVIIAVYVLIFFPVILYYSICEILAKGQSVGKIVMKTRVVTIDGNLPSVSNCLLRWLLYPLDTFLTGFLGVVFITFGRYRQRLGDLAAGTIVIKTSSTQYDFFSVSDYNYVQQGYEPTYPEAANLSTRQIDVITRTLYNYDLDRRNELLYKLAVQVQQFLGVQVASNVYADAFLMTVLNDFYYYSSTIEV
ncbi:MAG: RDD family protein [Muribaculaceae bacterium]|nr:RDD family protein [Muribaculaceae bacterium]